MLDPDAQNQHTVPYDQTPWSPPWLIPSYGGNGLGAGGLLEQMLKQQGLIPGGTVFPNPHPLQFADFNRSGQLLPPALPLQSTYRDPIADAIRLYAQSNNGFANAMYQVSGAADEAKYAAKPYT